MSCPNAFPSDSCCFVPHPRAGWGCGGYVQDLEPAPLHTGLSSSPPRVRRIIAAILLPLVVATLVGLIALWPDPVERPATQPGILHGTVESVTPPCATGM